MDNLELESKLKTLIEIEDFAERETQIKNFVIENINQVHYQVKPNDSDLCAILYEDLEFTFGDETSRFIECVAVELVRAHLTYSGAFQRRIGGALDDLDLRKLINDNDDRDGFSGWLGDYEFLDRSPTKELHTYTDEVVCDNPHMGGVQFDAAAFIYFDIASSSDRPIRQAIIRSGLTILERGAFRHGEMHEVRMRVLSHDPERAQLKNATRLDAQHGAARKLKEEIIKKWLRIGESEFEGNKTEFAKAQGLPFQIKTIVNDWLSPANIALAKSKIDAISENDR